MKKNTFVLVLMILLLSACENGTVISENIKNEEAAKNVIDNTPTPIIERSLERENLSRRAKFINQANRVGYLYLLTDNGQLVREEQVQGKVSSLNSFLTPMEYVFGTSNRVTLSAPDIDGTWGENSDGIFWFTPDGVYREWTGKYLFSSERLDFSSKPILLEKGSN